MIPCLSPGCNRWCRNNGGRTKHMRARHLIAPQPQPERPGLAPWLLDDTPPPEDFDAPPGGDMPIEEVVNGSEWEHHPLLCGTFSLFLSEACTQRLFIPATPCNEAGEYLPRGTPPSPPPAKSPNDWTPYRDRVDFELTEFLYAKVQMSGKAIDTLSQLLRACLLNHGVLPDDINVFERNADLLATIDSTPVGNVPWQGFTLSYDGPRPLNAPEWMTTTHDVWYRDPLQLVHNLLANRDFDNEFDYMPFREFDAKKRRRWRDFMSGDWAWNEADIIADNPDTHGSLLVPLILGSDKTTVSIATGQNDYYPAYLSIGNVCNNVRRAHRNALVLLAFLAIPKSKIHSCGCC